MGASTKASRTAPEKLLRLATYQKAWPCEKLPTKSSKSSTCALPLFGPIFDLTRREQETSTSSDDEWRTWSRELWWLFGDLEHRLASLHQRLSAGLPQGLLCEKSIGFWY